MTFAKSFEARREHRQINQAPTAIDHFHSADFHLKIVPASQQRILDMMQPGKDYSIGELAWLTKLEKSSVSGRRREMLDAGLIVQGQRRRCKFSDIHCETVKLKEEA